jgi:glutamate synthase (NADPH/NADH) small chain
MGKPTGFKEFQRQVPNDRDAKLRILDWNEFHDHMSDGELKTQGAWIVECRSVTPGR